MPAFDVVNDAHLNGFYITFKNGYTVSVQFGRYNYSDQGNTAEIAAFDRDGNWYAPWKRDTQDDVKGYATPEEVADFIYEVSQL
jgi:hypothetical protein